MNSPLGPRTTLNFFFLLGQLVCILVITQFRLCDNNNNNNSTNSFTSQKCSYCFIIEATVIVLCLGGIVSLIG